MEPYGLRRTLMKEFLIRGLYGINLQLYRGHKPREISDVDWRFYLDRLEMDPQGVMKMLRRDVTDPLDSILAPHQARWKGEEGNVISLLA